MSVLRTAFGVALGIVLAVVILGLGARMLAGPSAAEQAQLDQEALKKACEAMAQKAEMGSRFDRYHECLARGR